MKLNKIFTLMVSGIMVLAMVSCSSSTPSPKDVMEKINAGEKLEEADYQTMLDYMEDFCDVGKDMPATYEAGQEIAHEFPYFMIFASRLQNAPQEIKASEQYQETMTTYIYLMNR